MMLSLLSTPVTGLTPLISGMSQIMMRNLPVTNKNKQAREEAMSMADIQFRSGKG